LGNKDIIILCTELYLLLLFCSFGIFDITQLKIITLMFSYLSRYRNNKNKSEVIHKRMNLAQIKRRAWKETLILFILAQYKKIIQKLHDFVNLVQQMCSKKKK